MALTTTLTYTGSAAAQNTNANGSPVITNASPWASAVVVSNNLGAGISLFVRTDGGNASLAANTPNQAEIPPLTELLMENQQPLPNSNTDTWRDGVDGARSISETPPSGHSTMRRTGRPYPCATTEWLSSWTRTER